MNPFAQQLHIHQTHRDDLHKWRTSQWSPRAREKALPQTSPVKASVLH